VIACLWIYDYAAWRYSPRAAVAGYIIASDPGGRRIPTSVTVLLDAGQTATFHVDRTILANLYHGERLEVTYKTWDGGAVAVRPLDGQQKTSAPAFGSKRDTAGALATVAALIAILLTGYWLALAYVKARGPDAFRRRGG
jgi:hypothetical protein